LSQTSNVYLIALSTTGSAHIKFSYWAEPRFSFTYIVVIVTCSIVFLTLLVLSAFLFIVDCSIGQALQETVDSVKHTFVSTIEEMEPGKMLDESGNSLQGLTPERPTNMGFND
jgi:hypothetical protein